MALSRRWPRVQPGPRPIPQGRKVTHYEAGRYLGCPTCGRLLKIEWAVRSLVCSCGARVPVIERREGRLKPRRVGIDLAVVPGLLLLVARDLALYDPPRVLAWRLTHDAAARGLARWLGPLVPAASGVLDRDPIALLLSALAVLAALAYGTLAAAGASVRARALTIGLASALLVVLPSVAFISLGAAAERPYGQDGGVVQLPLAIHKILAGESPYGADYSGTILAKQARVSSFWGARGGNPILHHHAYLPGTHLVMLPFQLASRARVRLLRSADRDARSSTRSWSCSPRGCRRSGDARLAAAGCRGPQPARLLAPDLRRERPRVRRDAARNRPARCARGRRWPRRSLGLACATKQLAWPFAPFLLLACSGAGSFRDLLAPRTWRRLLRPLAVMVAVFLARRAPRGGPRLPGVLGRHLRLQRGPARGRQLSARRHARLRLRQLPDLLRPRREPRATTSRSRSSTRCSCRSASCSCARSCGRTTRSRRS